MLSPIGSQGAFDQGEVIDPEGDPHGFIPDRRVARPTSGTEAGKGQVREVPAARPAPWPSQASHKPLVGFGERGVIIASRGDEPGRSMRRQRDQAGD